MLTAAESLLLVIDIQERLLPVMQDGARVVRNAGILLQASARLEIPVLVTEQYPQGLGPTVPEIRTLAGHAATLPKMDFSAFGDTAIRRHIAGRRRRRIVVTGIEAHVCVLQTALGLVAEGHDVSVVIDAVSSRSADSVAVAQQRMASAGVTLVTAEMCVFEWLGTAAHPEFKALSRLIR